MILRSTIVRWALFCWCQGRGAFAFQPLAHPRYPISSKIPHPSHGTNLIALQSSTLDDTSSGYTRKSDSDEGLSAYMSENYRYAFMEPLLQWAVNSGVEFAPGTEIVADLEGDWGVELVEPKQQGSAVLTIPSEMILSTKDFQGTRIQQWMQDNMSDSYCLPECLLVLRLLEEVSKGGASPWQPWLESLPTDFTTGLFLDSFERAHVARMAPKFLEQHEKQWQTCSALVMKVVRDSDNILPAPFRKWLASQPNLSKTIQWAFSIILTRSWRTPDGSQATLVPMGDMFNHNSLMANVRPCFRASDNALQLCTTEDIECSQEQPAGIYLSYGLGHQPARFLVNFGFCDTSAPLIDVHLDRYLQRNGLPPINDEKTWPPFDPSHLVVSADNGVIAEDLWVIFLLKVLRERDPAQIKRIQKAYDSDDENVLSELVEELFEDWELPVTMELKNHFDDLLTKVYPEMTFSKHEHLAHPRLVMIEKYNSCMRETFLKTREYLNLVAEQTSKDLTNARL